MSVLTKATDTTRLPTILPKRRLRASVCKWYMEQADSSLGKTACICDMISTYPSAPERQSVKDVYS
eukprot:1549129-Amphidinium_carterae.1